jgi:hypothetical protein
MPDTTTITRRIDYVTIKDHGAAPVVVLGYSTEGYPDENGKPTLEPNTCTMGDIGLDLPCTEALAQEVLLRAMTGSPRTTKIKAIYPKKSARNGNTLAHTPGSIEVTVLIPKGDCLEKDVKITMTMAVPGQGTGLEGSGLFATEFELKKIMEIIGAVDAHNIERLKQSDIPSPYQQLSLLPPEDPNRESIAVKAKRQQLSIESAIDESSEAA